MPTYRDEAVVLRTHKLGEADRIITLLSRRRGKIRAVAKGVRRTSSKFGARLEPFSHVDLQFAEGRTLDIVTQVESLDAFGEPLVADYPGLHGRTGDAGDRRPAGGRRRASRPSSSTCCSSARSRCSIAAPATDPGRRR